MQTTQDASLRAGSSVDVVGFPIISMFKSTLEEAEFRGAAGFAATSRPVFVTAQQAIKGDFDGRLVQMDGELVGQDLTAAEPSLLLRSGGMLFPATLPRSAATGARLAWKEGSLLRITGVCNTQVDSTSISMGDGIVRQSSMHILLRSSGDVLTLKAPSWWTPRHTLEAFAVVGLLAFAAITWIAVLRRRVRQQTQALRDSEGRLRHLSEHDALTGLPNRILLNDRLGIALARATRFKTCLGLLMVDVDGFKGVNDALGHQAGDDLLRELACRLSACVRTTDTVARIGGDEFIVLLPDLRIPAEAEMIAAKILAAAARPMGLDQARAAITVSIGVVTDADGSSDAEALMQNADQAMYAAKKRGKNSFQVYGPELAERNGGTERVRQGTPRTSFLVGGA
jgi:diguanylate cyclase (GGDEF)-like protein